MIVVDAGTEHHVLLMPSAKIKKVRNYNFYMTHIIWVKKSGLLTVPIISKVRIAICCTPAPSL